MESFTLFKLFSPYNEIDLNHPVFAFEQSRLRWVMNQARVRQLAWLCWVWIPVGIAVAWLVLETIRHRNPTVRAYDVNMDALNAVFWLNLLWMGIASFYMIGETVGYLHQCYLERQWDLLRLTSQPEERIMADWAAIARLRAWPALMVEVCLRVTLVGLFCANIIFTFENSSLRVSWIPNVAFSIAFGLFLLLEIIYRHRVLVLLALLATTQVRSLNFGFLLAFFYALLIHAVQAAILACIVYGFNGVPYTDDGFRFGVIFLFVILPLVLIGYVLTLYFMSKFLPRVVFRCAMNME
jgi:hypothetical protein